MVMKGCFKKRDIQQLMHDIGAAARGKDVSMMGMKDI